MDKSYEHSNVSNADILSTLWPHLNDVLTIPLFKWLNQKFDEQTFNNNTDSESIVQAIMTDNIISRVNVIPNSLVLLAASEPHVLIVNTIVDYYLTQYVTFFKQASTVNELSRTKITDALTKHLAANDMVIKNLLEKTNTNNISPFIELTTKERKYVIEQCHQSFSEAIVVTIAESKRTHSPVLTFDQLLDHSSMLKNDYASLRAFEQISHLRDKKYPIQDLIKQHANQLLLTSNLDKLSIKLLLNQVIQAIGLSASKAMFKSILTSDHYPSSIDCLDSLENSLQQSIRGIDSLVQLSQTFLAKHPSIRNRIADIKDAIANIDNLAFDSTHSNKTSAAASDSHKSSNTPSQAGFFSSHSSGDNLLKFPQKIAAYKNQVTDYKNKCMATNQRTNFAIFYKITSQQSLTLEEVYTEGLETVQDQWKNNVLHLAVLSGNLAAFSTLLTNKLIDITAFNDFGDTLLHSAILGGNPAIVAALLAHPKISIHTANKKGMDAFSFALAVLPKESRISEMIMKSPDFDINKQYYL